MYLEYNLIFTTVKHLPVFCRSLYRNILRAFAHNVVCCCVLLRLVGSWMKFETGETSALTSANMSILSWSSKRGPTMASNNGCTANPTKLHWRTRTTCHVYIQVLLTRPSLNKTLFKGHHALIGGGRGASLDLNWQRPPPRDTLKLESAHCVKYPESPCLNQPTYQKYSSLKILAKILISDFQTPKILLSFLWFEIQSSP